MKWARTYLIFSSWFFTYISNGKYFIQLKRFLQNEIVNFSHLILMTIVCTPPFPLLRGGWVGGGGGGELGEPPTEFKRISIFRGELLE